MGLGEPWRWDEDFKAEGRKELPIEDVYNRCPKNISGFRGLEWVGFIRGAPRALSMCGDLLKHS